MSSLFLNRPRKTSGNRLLLLKVGSIVLLLSGLVLAVPQAQDASWQGSRVQLTARSWLTEINYYRARAGLTPVSNNPAWDPGVRNHLRYLRFTSAKYFTGRYQNHHTENPKSPYYTASGAREGARSDLFLSAPVGEPIHNMSGLQAIDGWLAAPFHAMAILQPNLTEVALVNAYGGAGLDVVSGLTFAPTKPRAIFFPGPGATTDLTSFQGEYPDPTQSCHWNRASKLAPGLPLFVMLPRTPSRGGKATLSFPNGKVERSLAGSLCIVDQYTYYTTDRVYGPAGLSTLRGDNAIVLIPSSLLINGHYTVTISQGATRSYSWSFKEDGMAPKDRPPSITLQPPIVKGRSVTINGVTLPAIPGVSIILITWNWGDDTMSSSWFPASHTYKALGTYRITATSIDSNELRASTSITVYLAMHKKVRTRISGPNWSI